MGNESMFTTCRWFQMHESEIIEKTSLAAYTKDGKKGLILEVDLEYPDKLHQKHNDYPLAAEN